MGRYEGYLMDTGGVVLCLDVGQSLHQTRRRIVPHYPRNPGEAGYLSAELCKAVRRLDSSTLFRFLDCREVVARFQVGKLPSPYMRKKLVLQS